MRAKEQRSDQRRESDIFRLYLHVELPQVVIENPTGQTAKAQVRAEACRTGIQGACADPRFLKVGHPHLYTATQ